MNEMRRLLNILTEMPTRRWRRAGTGWMRRDGAQVARASDGSWYASDAQGYRVRGTADEPSDDFDSPVRQFATAQEAMTYLDTFEY